MKEGNITASIEKSSRKSLSFSKALDLHMRARGDTAAKLLKDIIVNGENFTSTTISSWRRGQKYPRSLNSFEILNRIERRYDLPKDYFRKRLPHRARAGIGHKIQNMNDATRRRIAWHLPDDFMQRSKLEQKSILKWVDAVILSGSTDFRQYQAETIRHPFSMRFPEVMNVVQPIERKKSIRPHSCKRGSLRAPEAVSQEMLNLIKFKMSPLTPLGYERRGVWTGATAKQKIDHIGLFFGALAASPQGNPRGLGVPVENLGLGMLVFPQLWDWYLQWRKERRGFYTIWEVNMLRLGFSLVNKEAGWIRQNPSLVDRLRPVDGLISVDDIAQARDNWVEICDIAEKYFGNRAKEVKKLSRIHRDPFEPILPILESESPLKEYLKIADEVLNYMPDKKLYPKSAAEAVRSFLMLRIALHSGLRQKNLRQLLFCQRSRKHSSERLLTDRKCGELRWDQKDQVWEIFIPAVAFKNADSSFFGTRPFRLALPDLGGLYKYIDDYADTHRGLLLGKADDPGTFFVKTVKVTSVNAAYSQAAFYEAWRAIIQRHGIYNPYTKRGAVRGLLPHGPHNIRDVLATHVLKVTGSFEQASYAIQDTPEMISKHYGRFLPEDKAALAAKILNKVWES